MDIKMYCRWIPVICGALVISVLIKNLIIMCLVAFAWGMIWGHLFRSYIVPIVENKYVEKNWNKMMNRDFLTYWLPLILGGFFIALITQGESFVLLGIYGGLWGLIYGTFYWKIIKPKLDKMENADE